MAVITLGENTTNTHNSVLTDTWLDQANPTTTRDGSGAMFANSSGSGGKRALIRIDVSDLSEDITYQSATLNVYAASAYTNRNLFVHLFSRAFVTAEATWNSYSSGNNWGTAGGDISGTVGTSTGALALFSGNASVNGIVTITDNNGLLTSYVNNSIAGAKTMFLMISTDVTTDFRMHTSEFTDSFRPFLSVSTPVEENKGAGSFALSTINIRRNLRRNADLL